MVRRRLRHRSRERQSGYMLLLMMLAVALLAITLLGVATNYRQSIRRDREIEMIHRGVQYERAVRLYFRKNNSSYPPSIDRLLETNKIRYLRKRYKDPMTQDGVWKIAHLTDVNLPAANTGLGTSGTPSPGTATSPVQPGGANDNSESEKIVGGVPNPGGTTNTGPANTFGAAGDVLGGGPMIGVISKSTQEGVHSFNNKSKYSEWLFIYLPSQETSNQPGHIPTGPFNPNGITTTGIGGQPAPTTPGSTQGATPGTTTPGTTTPGTMTPGSTAPTPGPSAN